MPTDNANEDKAGPTNALNALVGVLIGEVMRALETPPVPCLSLNLKNAAAALDCSVDQIKGAINRGELRVTFIGRERFIAVDELKRFLSNRR